MGRQSGCYKCKDRAVGCHAHCETYEAERRRQDKVREKRREESMLRGYAEENRNRMRKRGDIKS